MSQTPPDLGLQTQKPRVASTPTNALDNDADRLQFELDMVRSQLRKEKGRRRWLAVALIVSLLCLALMVIVGAGFGILWFARAMSGRDSLMVRQEVAMANAQQARMMEQVARKQAVEAQRAAEVAKLKADELVKVQRQALNNAEETRKQMLSKLIKLSLSDAEDLRTKLQRQLSSPAQKNKLLDDPRMWQSKLNDAGDSLNRARLLLDASGQEADPGLAAELFNLRLLLKSIESELKE